MKNHIIIMSKFPRQGEVNTRMIPDIGAEKAMLVHQRMAENIVMQAQGFTDAKAIVHIANCTEQEAKQWLGKTEFIFQHGNDLGERMQNALAHSFSKGAEKVLVVGTDCPDLDSDTFALAFDSLNNKDIVYAPAFDGGYVLIGMKELQSSAFQDIDWGTETVLGQSLSHLTDAGISYHLLDPMRDTDFAKDIPEHFL